MESSGVVGPDYVPGGITTIILIGTLTMLMGLALTLKRKRNIW
jgi:uncharacterized membrane protein